MLLKKSARFVAALMLGLVLALSSYPAYSQGLPSFPQCFNEVAYYEDYTDLDEYNDRQVYCLFVVELIDGGVADNQVYKNDDLWQLMSYALGDGGDDQDNSIYDDGLTYQEITEEFPGNELTDLISNAIWAADQQSKLFPPSSFHAAIDGIIPDTVQTSSLKQYNGQSRGGTAAQNFSYNAARSRRKP